MKPRIFIWIVSLLAVLMTSSCAPAAPSNPAAPIDTLFSTSTAPASTSAPARTVPVSPQTAEVQVVATSRGPNLEATDPTTVNLASGQLQLIEFFRFT